MKKRASHIDFIRAVSIMGVIITHVYSYNLNTSLNFFIWNYLHFFVVAFVFCSGYVLVFQYKKNLSTIQNMSSWYVKRFKRLLIPLYVYLVSHYMLMSVFPALFSGLGLKWSTSFILKSIFLIGGIDLNWLPLLFIQLSLIAPFFLRNLTNKPILVLCGMVSIAAAVFFTIKPFPYDYYRLVMWIPWSGIFLLALVIAHLELENESLQKDILRYVQAAFIFGIIFICLFFGRNLIQTSSQFVLTHHKYPPNFYYLSYAAGMSFILLLVSRFSFLQHNMFKSIYTFISINAFSLYFIHYIVLDSVYSLSKSIWVLRGVFQQCMYVLLISLVICILLNRMQILFKDNIKKNMLKR